MRIRSIKPEFWRSPDVVALDWPTRLIFIGLWSYVDDNGVGIGRVPTIAADLFADDLSRDPRETLARVSRGLQTLSDAGLIVVYDVAGRPYLYVTGWEAHQRIDRPAKPRYPLPTCENASIRDTLATPSRHPRDTLATGTGEQGNRGTGEQVVVAPERNHRGEATEAETHAPRATALSKGWGPNAEHHARCLEGGIDLDREVRQFRDHARANGRRVVDWDAAFSVWLGNARGTKTVRAPTDRQAQILRAEMERAQAADAANVIHLPQIGAGS